VIAKVKHPCFTRPAMLPARRMVRQRYRTAEISKMPIFQGGQDVGSIQLLHEQPHQT
jgi:hypothetical protein